MWFPWVRVNLFVRCLVTLSGFVRGIFIVVGVTRSGVMFFVQIGLNGRLFELFLRDGADLLLNTYLFFFCAFVRD